MKNILVCWAIATFDRTKEKPLPVETRFWILPWDSVSKSEAEEILNILAVDLSDTPTEDDISLGEEEHSFSFRKPDLRMLRFRDRFEPIELSELERLTAPEGGITRFVPVNLGIEYFEDEQKRPISELQMLREVKGEAHPVLPHKPDSVLQLGPAARSDREASEDDSNKISRFLETVEYVAGSSWWQSPPSIKIRKGDISELIQAMFPEAAETQAVLLSLRQLYANDQLLNIACKRYVKLCDDERKTQWIQQTKTSFNEYLDNSANFPAPLGIPVRELIDVFLYGAGIVHSRATEESEVKLRHLLNTHGGSHVVMTIHCSLRFLFEYAIHAFLVIRQDFQGWLQSDSVPKPTRVSMHDVLSSYMREERKKSL